VGPVAVARGGTIWQITHQASGAGSANLFDGGSVISGSDATTSLDDLEMTFSTLDLTRPGVFGADASTSGRSDIRPVIATSGDRLVLNAGFSTSYTASSRLGADQPGGEAQGWMSSVVEFVVPVDSLDWRYDFSVVKQPGFSGTASLLVEDVTRSETLVDDSSSQTMFFGRETAFNGRAGDLIRLSFAASGSGSVPSGFVSHGGFDMSMQQVFTVTPEPTTALMLGLGALLVLKRRRSIRGEPQPGENHDFETHDDKHRFSVKC